MQSNENFGLFSKILLKISQNTFNKESFIQLRQKLLASQQEQHHQEMIQNENHTQIQKIENQQNQVKNEQERQSHDFEENTNEQKQVIHQEDKQQDSNQLQQQQQSQKIVTQQQSEQITNIQKQQTEKDAEQEKEQYEIKPMQMLNTQKIQQAQNQFVDEQNKAEKQIQNAIENQSNQSNQSNKQQQLNEPVNDQNHQEKDQLIIENRQQIKVQPENEFMEQPKDQQKSQQNLNDNDDQVQIKQPMMMMQNNSEEIDKKQLKDPPFLSIKKNDTQQSSERNISNLKEKSKQNSRKYSSQEDSINLQLTQKMKKSNNMVSTYGKADSLIYSDATLLYSNDTGFGRQTGQKSKKFNKINTDVQQQTNQRQHNHEENIQLATRIQRAVSRQVPRLRTDSQNKTDLEMYIKTQQDIQEEKVMITQLYDKKKISKIREIKEKKKLQLERQLKKVNEQLEQLIKKQNESRSHPKSNNYQSRVKISDNLQARHKAERLIKNLRYEKKSRHDAQLDELHAIDKNINQYMQEIVKERHKNQDRMKQKKKLQIIERMKKQELRKIEQQKMKDKNLQFLHGIKHNISKNNLAPVKSPPQQRKDTQIHVKQRHFDVESASKRQRSHTKKSESVADEHEMTPELSKKKALMKRLRNFSVKKQGKKIDVYEQVLG